MDITPLAKGGRQQSVTKALVGEDPSFLAAVGVCLMKDPKDQITKYVAAAVALSIATSLVLSFFIDVDQRKLEMLMQPLMLIVGFYFGSTTKN